MSRKSRCLAARSCDLILFALHSDLPGGRVSSRKRPLFLSPRTSSLAWRGKNRCKKEGKKETRWLCDPRLRETSKGRGSIEMTVKKKEREENRHPEYIGTDTKSLIWPAGFFPQVDETPFPRAGIPPLLCILSGVARGKKKKEDSLPRYVGLTPTLPPPKKKKKHSALSYIGD